MLGGGGAFVGSVKGALYYERDYLRPPNILVLFEKGIRACCCRATITNIDLKKYAVLRKRAKTNPISNGHLSQRFIVAGYPSLQQRSLF